MSLNAATIACLIAKGFGAVDILEVAQAMEAAKDATGAARQSRFRKRRKAESNGVTVTRDGFPLDSKDILPPSATPVISNEITPPAQNDDLPVLREEHVLEAYNATAARAGLPKAKMTPERRKRIKTFIRRHEIDDITEAIAAMERSPFCRGENDRGWKANFDFLLQPSSFAKLTEGTYG